MSGYRTEFPSFGVMPEVADLIARGYTDESWHNDSAPTFIAPDLKTRVWIEHADPAQREYPDGPRFGVEAGHYSHEAYAPTFDLDIVHAGDDWAEVLRIVDARATGSAS